MLTLTNSFHNTSTATRKTREEINNILNTAPWERTATERSWIRRISHKLCGATGCVCGQNEINER
jgi:hypothetical protein